jgi:flagellar motor switch protein FliN/FliY
MTGENDKLDLDDLTGADNSDADDIEMESESEADAEFPTFDLEDDDAVEKLEAIYDVPVQVSAVLGKTSMPISQLIRLGRGAILELDRKVGESVDVVVNNRLVARGEVVLVDERIGITMTEIIKSDS